MKLHTTTAVSILLAGVLANTAYAQDTSTPELLSGVSADAVEVLSPDEADKTRGERVRQTQTSWGICGWSVCKKTSTTYGYQKRYGRYGSYYVNH